LVARLAGLGGDAADPSQIRDDPRFRRFLAELIARDTSWAASRVAAGSEQGTRDSRRWGEGGGEGGGDAGAGWPGCGRHVRGAAARALD
jgi:hypothetical protein